MTLVKPRINDAVQKTPHKLDEDALAKTLDLGKSSARACSAHKHNS